jgi:RimJ/RimL family protein N-acetyltransferase
MDRKPFRIKPTLAGERGTLRPFEADDLGTMAEILADPEVLRLTASVHSTAEAEATSPVPDDRLRAWYSTRNDHADRLDLAIVDVATGRVVGEVVLNELEPEVDACGIRILIGPEGRDRGLGTEAMRLAVDHAFSTTDVYRLSLEVYDFNPRGRRVYEKVGFVEEGRRRAALMFDDERFDAIVMSILRPEWAARQVA